MPNLAAAGCARSHNCALTVAWDNDTNCVSIRNSLNLKSSASQWVFTMTAIVSGEECVKTDLARLQRALQEISRGVEAGTATAPPRIDSAERVGEIVRSLKERMALAPAEDSEGIINDLQKVR